MVAPPFPTRRSFVVLTGTGLVGLIACTPKHSAKDTSQDTDTDPDTSTDTDDSGSGDACEPTGDDIEGPYWIEGVPVRTEYDLYGHEGVSLTIAGQVLGVDCEPIPDAIVEIWHAMPSTVQADALELTDSVDYDNSSAEMQYRGQMSADEEGRYSFHTLKPGWYLNGDEIDDFRPSHIHVIIWVGGEQVLTTQLYFEGDPFIPNDPWAEKDRAVALSEDGEGALSGSFDFVVDTKA